jgi:DNA uptake protein ComE-like DNA-binding protein
VELSDGKDLATELVRQGLARARGVATNGPGARTSDRYKSNLSDIELQAAKRGNGIWKFTDWNRLPLERDDQRKEEEEDQIATGEVLPNDFRLNPNTASRDNLDRLPGIGPTLADRILETREDFEFKIPSDLKQVPGIKEGIIKKFEHYLDFTKP